MDRRGPDDQGTEFIPIAGGALALGQTRLAVIDLTAGGHQPMHAANFSLVFNGEIYNYVELRRELQQTGVDFRTASDTEVLLHAWARWGKASLPKLAGMFAFAVFDHARETLTCVRDPFGIKPFFYAQDRGSFSFASELPALKTLRPGGWRPDLQRAYDYLMFGDYDSTEQCFVEGVRHLLPGHLLEVRVGEQAVPERWWTPRVAPVTKLSFGEAAAVLREKFLESVRRHLRSDVPLGVALSGGLDSSAVVCAVRHIEPEMPLHTFSYVASGSEVSEEYWVDRVNAHVGAKSHKVHISPTELVRDIDDMILSQGEPFSSTSIYAQYRVYQLARQHGVTVTLDGQGADELLAGYSGYPAKRVHSLVDERRFGEAWRFLRGWGRWPNRQLSYGVKASAAQLLGTSPSFQYIRKLSGLRQKAPWLNTDVLRAHGVSMNVPQRAPSPWDQPGRRLVSELARAATRQGLPSLLRHGDRNSMRFSVESRVPFLSPELADFLLALPEEFLISPEGETKRILRTAMRGIVPDDVLDRRDKIGFSTPELDWLRQIAPAARRWLSEGEMPIFLEAKPMMAEFEAVIAGKRPFSGQLWRWINLIRWHTHMFNR